MAMPYTKTELPRALVSARIIPRRAKEDQLPRPILAVGKGEVMANQRKTPIPVTGRTGPRPGY